MAINKSVKAIRTKHGDIPIDYKSLANTPSAIYHVNDAGVYYADFAPVISGGKVFYSEIFNDHENNVSQSYYSHAEGYNTVAGLSGYYYDKAVISPSGTDGVSVIRFYLSKTQFSSESIIHEFELNDVVSIVYNSKYHDIGYIIAVGLDNMEDENWIDVLVDDTLTPLASDGGWDSSTADTSDLAMDDFSIWVAKKPTAGPVMLGWYAHAEGEQTVALERSSHAEGRKTRAEGQYAHTEGRETKAYYAAHAEGYKTNALGFYSHVEGMYTGTNSGGSYGHAEGRESIVNGMAGHAEGWGTLADANSAHAEGHQSKSLASYSHAEGYRSISSGKGAHSEGYQSNAIGDYSHAEGFSTNAGGKYTHVEGYYTIASCDYQHVQGRYNIEDTENRYAHIVGSGTSTAARKNIHTLDWSGNAWFGGSITVGRNNDTVVLTKDLAAKKGSVSGSLVGGADTATASANGAVAFGHNVSATAVYSMAINQGCIASGPNSFAFGNNTESQGMSSVAGGVSSKSIGKYSLAFGVGSISNGQSSIAINQGKSNATSSIAVCSSSVANGYSSMAIGVGAVSDGEYSRSFGYYTTSSGKYQCVLGKYNISDDTKAIIVGAGTANTARKNIYTLDWDGNAYYKGFVESEYIVLRSPNGSKFKISVDDSGNISSTAI